VPDWTSRDLGDVSGSEAPASIAPSSAAAAATDAQG